MNKHFTLLLFIGLAWGEKEVLAMFDFSSNSVSLDDTKILAERIQTELIKLEKYKFVERSKIDQILSEQKFQMSGCVDECLIEVGKMVGATSVIIGSFGKFGNYYTVNVKMISATTSEIKKAVSYDSEYELGDLLIIGSKDIAY